MTVEYRAVFDDLRCFGVEIEVYDVLKPVIAQALNRTGVRTEVTPYSHRVYPWWRVSTDSSIKGSRTAEIVSPILSGQAGLDQVAEVLRVLRSIGCKTNKSCGFHIHWNCQDYTGKNVLSLLRFYSKFERVIDYLVPEHRRGNLNKHCRTLVKDNNLDWVSELDSSERARAVEVVLSFNEKHTSVYRDPVTGEEEIRASRYHKVNIASYAQYGTIEFRQYHGVLDSEQVLPWIVFTQQIVNKAKTVSVAKQVSAKPTLGEMLRVLKLVDHEFIKNQCTDLAVLTLPAWLKERYTGFREGTIRE